MEVSESYNLIHISDVELNSYIDKIYNVPNIESIYTKNQGDVGVCSLLTVTYVIELLLRKNNNNKLLSVYNAYLKSYFCANKLNPNNPNNYKIIQPSCSINNYGQDNGFSIKNTINGGIHGICYNTQWDNIVYYVSHQPNFTFPYKNMNPLLTEDYTNHTDHVYISQFIKLVPKITNIKKNQKITFEPKEINIITDQIITDNNLYMAKELYDLKDSLYEFDHLIDNYKYNDSDKNMLINKIKNLLVAKQLPILINIILPKNIDEHLNKKHCLANYNKCTFDDYHACLIVGYNTSSFKILSSWGNNTGNNGCFYIDYNYLFKKSDGNQINLDVNQIYMITIVSEKS